MDLSNFTELVSYVQENPLQAAVNVLVISGLVARFTANAKTGLGRTIHKLAMKLSTKIQGRIAARGK